MCSVERFDLLLLVSSRQVWSTGSITNSVKAALKVGGFSTKIEVECRSLEEAYEAAEAGAHIIMLDNYTPVTIKPDAKARGGEGCAVTGGGGVDSASRGSARWMA